MGIFSSFKKLKTGLSKTSEAIASTLKSSIGLDGDRLSAETLDELETALIQADVGLEAAEKLVAALARERFEASVADMEIRQKLADLITEKLDNLTSRKDFGGDATPQVVLMVGVNGSGKTTTTAKLAEMLKNQGKSVLLAAADTFRAGAVDQLRIWAERTKIDVITPESNSTDAASVAFQAAQRTHSAGIDVLIVDTAGRLQNRADLMAELAKIRRTITKHIPEENITTLLVLDGTVGQNALSQLKAFRAATPLSGLVVTKLDSSAKGGILLALAAEDAPPVHFITTGETVEDMHPFDPNAYARSLLGLES